MRVLSLGAGVQSTCLALLAAEGEIEAPDFAVFADTNIDWLTPTANARRRLLAGRGTQKITRDTALEIRRRFKAGERQCDLRREYPLSKPQMSAICRGRSWAW